MKKRQILWAIALSSALAACGDNNGPTGSGGSGGSNAGPSNSSCEAICASPCVLGGVDPSTGMRECVSGCQAGAPQFDDDCGSEADAFLGCVEAEACDENAQNCNSQRLDWSNCLNGLTVP